MFRLFGLLVGFGLLLLLVKGIVLFLPLLIMLFVVRMIVGGFGLFGFHRAHAYNVGRGRPGYSRHNSYGSHGYQSNADRYENCYRSRYDESFPSERRGSQEPRAATGPTVRL